MQTLEQQVRKIMIDKGANPFWADAAMRWIESAMNTNRYFAKGVSDFRIARNKKNGDGMIRIFSFDVLFLFPDTNEEKKARLSYSFNPERKMAHKVLMKFYS